MQLKCLGLVVLLAATTCGLRPCLFTITNDSNESILVVNPNGQGAVYIQPGKTKIIDPRIQHRILKYFYSEKLDIYVQLEPDTFYKKYTLTEAYCIENYLEENRLSLSDIEQLVKKPTRRLSVEGHKELSAQNKDDSFHSH